MIRIMLVFLCAVVLGLAIAGLRVGWRHRAERQSALPSRPDVPSDLGPLLLGPLEGLYVGTTFADSWQNRVVHDGLGERASASASLYETGVMIEREGASRIFLPAGSVLDARLAPGLAGKVVGAGGVLVIRWGLGDVTLDTGLRADDKSAYPDWVRAVQGLVHA